MKDMNSPTVFYIVLIIAVLNVLGYTSTKDWNSLTFFLLASGVTYAVTQHRVLSLVVGVVGASLFRASGVMHREGLTTDPDSNRRNGRPSKASANSSKPIKNSSKPERGQTKPERGQTPMPKPALSAAPTISAFAETIEDQEQLLKVSKQMGPMVESMNQMLKNLPEGFLDKAMASLKNQNNILR